MSTRRTITVTLTEAQWSVLGHAVDYFETVIDDDPVRYSGKMTALKNAWARINEAWHGAAR